MGTRAYIGIKNNDDSIAAIYNHSDGGLQNLGHILRKYFTTEEKVRQLIDLGGISSIVDETDFKEYFADSNENWTVVKSVPECHICKLPAELPSTTLSNIEEVMGGMICYAYLFIPSENKWYYTKGHGLKPLKS